MSVVLLFNLPELAYDEVRERLAIAEKSLETAERLLRKTLDSEEPLMQERKALQADFIVTDPRHDKAHPDRQTLLFEMQTLARRLFRADNKLLAKSYRVPMLQRRVALRKDLVFQLRCELAFREMENYRSRADVKVADLTDEAAFQRIRPLLINYAWFAAQQHKLGEFERAFQFKREDNVLHVSWIVPGDINHTLAHRVEFTCRPDGTVKSVQTRTEANLFCDHPRLWYEC